MVEPGKYLVLATATVRAGPDPDSEKVGEHKAGTVIEVVQEAVNSSGLTVVQTITPPQGLMRGGWVKHVTSKGKLLLEQVGEQAAPVPPGTKMITAAQTPYFGRPENDPNVLGVLPPGSMIDVQQSMTDARGRTKIKHIMGWSPTAAPDGTVLFNLVPVAGAPAAAAGTAEEGVPPTAFGAEPGGPPPGEPGGPPPGEPGGPPPGEPAGFPPSGGAMGMGGSTGLSVVTQRDATKLIPSEGILKVGWVMKSSGGKKAADGAELVQIIEQWQQRLFTLGKDVEGIPVMCWYKNVDQYKARTPSNPNTGSYLSLTVARAEIVTTGDMKDGATLEDDAQSAAKRASGSSDLRRSQTSGSVMSKQFVVITPQRNLKCEVIDPNDSAQEWVDLINSVALDGAIASSGQKRFSLGRKLSQKTL